MTNRTSEFAYDTCCGDGDGGGGGNAPFHERRVCQCYAPTCAHYLCAVCGVAVPWHKNLMITNPTISGRFCNGCIDVEAAYHGLSVEEMLACRVRLRVKRIAQNRKHHGFREEPQDPFDRVDMTEVRLQGQAFRPERLIPPPSQPYLERGEACWCHRAKDCDGNHEFHRITAVNLCGLCGETFEISKTDPHWSSGRGPICPKRS